MIISNEQLEESLNWIAENIEEHAKAYANTKISDDRLRRVESQGYRNASGKTIDDRKAESRTTPEFEEAIEFKHDAFYQYDLLNGLMNYHQARIQTWRTVQANNRRENVT